VRLERSSPKDHASEDRSTLKATISYFGKLAVFTVATISCCGSHKNSNISATIHAYSE
jgi:hypothetical protein